MGLSDKGKCLDRISGVTPDQKWTWKKTRLIHLCSRRSSVGDTRRPPRGSGALSAPAPKSLGSWLTLSRCWGGCAWYGDNKQSLEIWPKLTLATYQSDSPSCITLATREVFLIRWSPPTLSVERCSYIHPSLFFSHVGMKMLFYLHVQTATWLAGSANSANNWHFHRRSGTSGIVPS